MPAEIRQRERVAALLRGIRLPGAGRAGAGYILDTRTITAGTRFAVEYATHRRHDRDRDHEFQERSHSPLPPLKTHAPSRTGLLPSRLTPNFPIRRQQQHTN